MSDMFGPASLSVGQTLSSFITFMPKLSDVRKTDANANPEMVGDVSLNGGRPRWVGDGVLDLLI